MMEPPKVGAPRKIARKTCSFMRSPQEPTMETKNHTQLEGVLDVDSISSLIIKLLSPTMVEEQEPAPSTRQMDIDPKKMVEEKNPMQQPSMETVRPANEEDEEINEFDEQKV
jgi:hypothetical protein